MERKSKYWLIKIDYYSQDVLYDKQLVLDYILVLRCIDSIKSCLYFDYENVLIVQYYKLYFLKAVPYDYLVNLMQKLQQLYSCNKIVCKPVKKKEGDSLFIRDQGIGY